MKTLSILVPCYNERATITVILRRLKSTEYPGWHKEVIVIDDGSTDGTTELLRANEGECQIIFLSRNEGKGSAITHGLAVARGEYVIIQDADLEYDPKEIGILLARVSEGTEDVIFGSRNLGHLKKSGFIVPRVGVWLVTKTLNVLYGLTLTDAWTGYKLFSRKAGRYFLPGGFESEVLFTAALARHGFRIIEVPISHRPRSVQDGKKIHYRDGLYTLFLLLKHRFASSKNFTDV